MMALLLGHSADTIHEIQRLLEVGEGEGASDVVFVDDFPIRELVAERVQWLALQRWHTTSAGNTCLAGQEGHGRNSRPRLVELPG